MSTELVAGAFSALLGVGLGAFLAPYIERNKFKAESKYAVDCFYSELDDYLQDLPSIVKNFHEGYGKVVKHEMAMIKRKDFFPITFSPKIEFLTINNVMDKSFLNLTSDQRKAIKALISISNGINNKVQILRKCREMDDFEKSDLWVSARMSASMYYVASRLLNEKERFKYFEKTNDEMCEEALKALGVSFELKDLLKKNA